MLFNSFNSFNVTEAIESPDSIKISKIKSTSNLTSDKLAKVWKNSVLIKKIAHKELLVL